MKRKHGKRLGTHSWSLHFHGVPLLSYTLQCFYCITEKPLFSLKNQKLRKVDKILEMQISITIMENNMEKILQKKLS